MRDDLIGPFGPVHLSRDGALGRVAEKAWLLSWRDCDAEGRFEVLPDSHFGLGILLEGAGCRAIVGGPISQTFMARPGEREIYWIRFRPGCLPRLADVAPADLIDAPGIALDRLPGLDLDDLGERLVATPSARGRLRILARSLADQGEPRLCQDRRCRQILEMVDRLDGCLRVQDLAAEFGLSMRSLQRLLLAQVGLSPKRLIDHVRLQRTVQRLRAGPGVPGHARLAAECGFADQSHMIRDLSRRTGHLPTALQAAVAFVQAGEPSER